MIPKRLLALIEGPKCKVRKLQKFLIPDQTVRDGIKCRSSNFLKVLNFRKLCIFSDNLGPLESKVGQFIFLRAFCVKRLVTLRISHPAIQSC